MVMGLLERLLTPKHPALRKLRVDVRLVHKDDVAWELASGWTVVDRGPPLGCHSDEDGMFLLEWFHSDEGRDN